MSIRTKLPLIFAVAWLVAVPTIAHADEPADSYDKLFDPNHVVDVHISIKSEDWDRVRLQSRSLFDSLRKDRIPDSPFKYAKGDVTIDGVLIKDVGIRKKGFLGSLDEDRPSLKIKFDKYKDQAPFGVLDRLTLNNNKQDASRLSQYLGYKLFNESGTVASRCNFAKVTVNDQYLGIYSNVESIEPPMLQRGFGDGEGMLFEGTVADLRSDMAHRFELKTDDSTLDDIRRIAAILEEDELDVEKLESLLDVEAFVKFWAMESLIGFWDGYTHNQNNFFFYRNPANSKYYFIPWGVDSAFTYAVPSIIDPIPFRSFHCQSVLANRLYRDPEIRELYRATLEEFLATHWNEETLLADIDRVETLLSQDVYEGNEKFSADVTRVRSFIKGRRRLLQKELERWPIPLSKGAKQPGYVKEVGKGRAAFTTQWYDASPKDPETRGKLELELTLRGERVAFRQIGATAEPDTNRPPSESGVRPPIIVLTGIRQQDGKRLSLKMGLDIKNFRPSKRRVGMMGVLMEGGTIAFMTQMIFNPASLMLVDAQVTFDQASMKPGATVQGDVNFTIIQFAGGKSPNVPWE